MNSGRGAKGSVNDRIISFLYRKRYVEYLKKKENYTKEERERAIEYLKKIKYYDIEDNFDVLETEDKAILEDEYADLQLTDFVPNIYENSLEKKTGYNDLYDIKNMSDTPNKETIDIDDLINKVDKVQSFDPFSENYDFEKYDYYEVIGNHKGVGKVGKHDEVLDFEKEEKKLTDEQVIIEEVTEFVDDSVKELESIKSELDYIKQEVDNLHTEEDVKRLDEKFNELKEKLDKLYQKYEIMKEKYDFEDYEILDNIKLIDSIDDYKDKASLEEIELMVEACKYEIEAIDGVVIEEEKKAGIGEEISNKNKIIKDRDNAFKKKSSIVYSVEDEEEVIKREMEEQKKIISDLDEKLAQITTETEEIREYVRHTGLMFRSFLRITAGILTAPFSNTRVFNTMLGVNLINRGLNDLRTSLVPEERTRTEIRYRYTDVEREILNAKDDLNSTMNLLNNSLDQISDLKKYFNEKFEHDAQYIPNYYEIKNMINNLEETLNEKKKEITKLDNKLDNQYQDNKQKVLRANTRN